MKLLHLTVQFQYVDAVERILDRHDVARFVRVAMVAGRDRDGMHDGSQVWPGSVTLVQAQVDEEALDDLLADLGDFRDEKEAHAHLEALVLPVERRL